MELLPLEQGMDMVPGTNGDTQLNTPLHEGYHMKVQTVAHCCKNGEENYTRNLSLNKQTARKWSIHNSNQISPHESAL